MEGVFMIDARTLETLHGYYLVKTNAIYKLIGHTDFASPDRPLSAQKRKFAFFKKRR